MILTPQSVLSSRPLDFTCRDNQPVTLGEAVSWTKGLEAFSIGTMKRALAQGQSQLDNLMESRLGLDAGPMAEALDREIDQVVYGLYGLTEKEVKIVEGSGKRNER